MPRAAGKLPAARVGAGVTSHLVARADDKLCHCIVVQGLAFQFPDVDRDSPVVLGVPAVAGPRNGVYGDPPVIVCEGEQKVPQLGKQAGGPAWGVPVIRKVRPVALCRFADLQVREGLVLDPARVVIVEPDFPMAFNLGPNVATWAPTSCTFCALTSLINACTTANACSRHRLSLVSNFNHLSLQLCLAVNSSDITCSAFALLIQ